MKKYHNLIYIILGSFFALGVLTWALLSANGILSINFDALNNPSEPVPTEVFVRSGGVRVNSNQFSTLPTEAVITIGGEEKTLDEDIIDGIEPGVYEMTIKIPDYQRWESEINIEASLITDISPFFFPTDLELTQALPNRNIDKVFFSTYDDFAYYIVKNAAKGADNGIFRLNLSESATFFNPEENQPEKIINIIPQISDAIDRGEYEIIPSPDNQKIIFNSNLTEKFIFDVTNNNPTPEVNELVSVEKILGYLPAKWEWFKGSSSLIIEQNNLVAELVLSNSKTILITFNPDLQPIYGVNGDSVIYFSHIDKNLYRYQDESKQEISVENIEIPQTISKLFVDRNTADIVIFESEGTFFYLNLIDSFITEVGENINPIKLNKDGSGLLYQKDNNLFTFSIKENITRDDYDVSNTQLFENFDPELTSVDWNTQSSHIIVLQKTNTEVKNFDLINILEKNGTNITNLIDQTTIKGTNVHMLESNQAFYILLETSEPTEDAPGVNNLFKIDLEVSE